jgi:hypothetical protein
MLLSVLSWISLIYLIEGRKYDKNWIDPSSGSVGRLDDSHATPSVVAEPVRPAHQRIQQGRIRLVGTLKDHQGAFYLAGNIMRGYPVP